MYGTWYLKVIILSTNKMCNDSYNDPTCYMQNSYENLKQPFLTFTEWVLHNYLRISFLLIHRCKLWWYTCKAKWVINTLIGQHNYLMLDLLVHVHVGSILDKLYMHIYIHFCTSKLHVYKSTCTMYMYSLRSKLNLSIYMYINLHV